jgi:hypothetical protein
MGRVPRRVHRFRRDAVEGLRQPLEDGRVSSRGSESLYEPDAEPAAEGTAILQSLMNVGTSGEQLEFLGG